MGVFTEGHDDSEVRIVSAATVSVRTAAIFRKELQYGNIKEHFRTDSQVVLGYKQMQQNGSTPLWGTESSKSLMGANRNNGTMFPASTTQLNLLHWDLNAENLKKCGMALCFSEK
ncbi:hypothetical protein HOLleu_39289 [Holothuria leucospilota]|uniref:Uncharacterized protein n=1 Tax=Holothuria leucospilota TaxID=206669 RepID=A0A9Q0YFZ6_HOLLE|nr:hypothetical protein HOLleu_39289 [Holothuria leucospilota]